MTMAQESGVKTAAWKQIVGGLFVLLAFVIGAVVAAIIGLFLGVFPFGFFLVIPWVFGSVAYWLVKRWTARC